MSTSQGKWREEQILVICPGSHTTMAQMGVGELSPPAHRFPTRMFKDDESNNWRPYHTFKRKKANPIVAVNGTANPAPPNDEDDWEYVEDPDSTEGAIYPMQGGKIVHMDAFLAFLDHIHNQLVTTYHNTPILLMASPQWTKYDAEAISRFIFEKSKTPALCLIHSGLATQYGLRHSNMTVVDIGFEKVDVTCIHDSRVVSQLSLGSGIEGSADEDISGGEIFTRKLMELLKGQNFTHEMAEQLKKSPICEVLPYAPEHKELMELPTDGASAGTAAPAPGQPGGPPENLSNAEPPKPAGANGDEDAYMGDQPVENDDGVLDVASIVTSGQTKDFLAKKEKEKAERAKAGKRGKNAEAAAEANKPARLPNSKRKRNVFHFEEYVTEDKTRAADSAPKAQEQKQATPPATDAPSTDAPKVEGEGEPKPQAEGSSSAVPAVGGAADSSAPKPEEPANLGIGDPLAEPAPTATAPVHIPEPEPAVKRARRDIEVGLERFTFAERAFIDRIVFTIYRAVQGIELMYMRPACWDNIVFVGNGSKLRGLKENIIQTLSARHIISPSTATMFTSELPSNLATPSGTGSQTPTSQFAGAPHQLPTSTSSGVNPLLQAATTASLALPRSDSTSNLPGAPGSSAGDSHPPQPAHHFHSQTPTSIKLASFPTYLSEWTKHGFEESMFLGSLVAARLAYCVHNLDMAGLEAQRMMSLSRIEYNERGPKAIKTHSMLG